MVEILGKHFPEMKLLLLQHREENGTHVQYMDTLIVKLLECYRSVLSFLSCSFVNEGVQ